MRLFSPTAISPEETFLKLNNQSSCFSLQTPRPFIHFLFASTCPRKLVKAVSFFKNTRTARHICHFNYMVPSVVLIESPPEKTCYGFCSSFEKQSNQNSIIFLDPLGERAMWVAEIPQRFSSVLSAVCGIYAHGYLYTRNSFFFVVIVITRCSA